MGQNAKQVQIVGWILVALVCTQAELLASFKNKANSDPNNDRRSSDPSQSKKQKKDEPKKDAPKAEPKKEAPKKEAPKDEPKIDSPSAMHGHWVHLVPDSKDKAERSLVYHTDGTYTAITEVNGKVVGLVDGTWEYSNGLMSLKAKNGEWARFKVYRLSNDRIKLTILECSVASLNGKSQVFDRR